ncbi:hypothetical protein [Siminovitchia terrae]|uniref:Uncharacterized protein n=1 Tax=Siminovitchia terrae TaxID=1914933 RepID=A0A429XBG2_SIMTE|nr:hypothetical protein [Siminovitchia terrae]RST60631.1 hypothetical protein D5F11_004555 [Siminovitchia terrae]
MIFHSVEVQTRLNKVKASDGCHRFSEEIYRAELDKIWAQIRQGAFDKNNRLVVSFVYPYLEKQEKHPKVYIRYMI